MDIARIDHKHVDGIFFLLQYSGVAGAIGTPMQSLPIRLLASSKLGRHPPGEPSLVRQKRGVWPKDPHGGYLKLASRDDDQLRLGKMSLPIEIVDLCDLQTSEREWTLHRGCRQGEYRGNQISELR